MPHNPAENLLNAPFEDLLVILLRQFRRLLAERGVELTDAQINVLAQQIAARVPIDQSRIEALQLALTDIITESEGLLRRWSPTFAHSLRTTMEDIPGWETTAEFLEIANEKTNAELRVSAGSALAAACGARAFAPYLLDVIAYDAGANDVDAVFARRALCFAAGINPTAPDWLERAQAWVEGGK